MYKDRFMEDTGAHTPLFFSVYGKYPRPLIIKISYFVYYSAQRKRIFTEVTKRHYIESPTVSGGQGLWPSGTWPLLFGCGGLSVSCFFHLLHWLWLLFLLLILGIEVWVLLHALLHGPELVYTV